MIVRNSKYFRQYEELFSHIMVFGGILSILSIISSLINTLFIYHHIKNNLIKNLNWLLVSVIPLISFFIIILILILVPF